MQPDARVTAFLPRHHGRRRRIAIAITAIVIVVVVAALVASRLGGAARPTYRTEAVTRMDLVIRVSAPGALELIDPRSVPAPVAGLVEEVRVEEDAPVQAGTLLATLDAGALGSEAARAAAEQRAAQAEHAAARAALATAEDELARARRLRAARLVSDEEVERLTLAVRRARAGVDAAAAAIEAARAGARGAQVRADRTEVRAPIDGTVVRVEAKVGAVVGPDGPPLFVIAPRLDALRLVAQIDEADVGAVGPDSTATFTVPAWPGQVFSARLLRVRTTPTERGAGISYDALLEADNPDGRLRPGMSASVTLVVARRPDALVVPEAALRWSPDGSSSGRSRVYRLDGDVLEAVRVTPGPSDGRHTEIAGPLQPGDLVVTGVVTGPGRTRLGGS